MKVEGEDTPPITC